MKEQILRNIEARLGEGFKVEEHEQIKQNGEVLHGIIVKKEGSSVAPQIYIDDLEEDMVEDFVVSKYREVEENGMPDVDGIKSLLTKEKVSEIVFPVLVNRCKNKEWFKENQIVHKKFLDIEIIYKIPVGDDGYVTVTKQLLEHLDMTKEELDKAAVENVQGKSTVRSMFDLLPKELTGLEEDDDVPAMMVVSNIGGTLGAGMILDDSAIEKLNDKLGDFYVIPSSIHELIVVPESVGEAEGLKKMVKDVNKTLDPKDVLSNNVYVCRSGKLEVA